MKTLIVREAFTLGAEFFARGAEITDPALITQAKDEFPGHVLESQADAEEPKAVLKAPVVPVDPASPGAEKQKPGAKPAP